MILNGKKYRVGSWAEPYVEELLAGFHIHNPTCYLGRKIQEGRPLYGKLNSEGQTMRVNFIRSYHESWARVLGSLTSARIKYMSIEHPKNGNPIYILEKHFKRFLKNRKVDEYKGLTLYKVEDRMLLFPIEKKKFRQGGEIIEAPGMPAGNPRRAIDYGMFKVYPAKYKKISDILVEETLEQLDLKEAS